MRKTFLTVSLAFVCALAPAQVMDVLERVKADRNLASSCEAPYDFDVKYDRTPAPKGYKPFYISHYGRHGSRYAWNKKTYPLIHETLNKASELGVLTPRGKKFFKDYEAFYFIPKVNFGDLTGLGWEQHTRLAESIYKEFRPVFRHNRKVNAMASIVPRAIVSMGAFCTSLQKQDRGLEIEGNSLHTNMVYVNPARAPKDLGINDWEVYHFPGEVHYKEFSRRILDHEAILSSLFTDTSFIGDIDSKGSLINELYLLWAGYRNYAELDMDGIFTPDQIAVMWENHNYGCYCEHGALRNAHKYLVRNIVDLEQAAEKGNGVAMDARFGHDLVMNAFNLYLNIDNCGHTVQSPSEVKYWFQNYITPKASTILFVFYRKPGAETIFKVLRNGREVSLSSLTPVSWPYYKLSDFENTYAK